MWLLPGPLNVKPRIAWAFRVTTVDSLTLAIVMDRADRGRRARSAGPGRRPVPAAPTVRAVAVDPTSRSM